MTSRVLPPAEWSRLAGTELEQVWPHLPVERTRIVVVELDGAIVGCWAAFLHVHVEGVWIAPAHRGKTSVARRLLRGMRAAVDGLGSHVVATASADPDVTQLLIGLGAIRLPGEHYALSL